MFCYYIIMQITKITKSKRSAEGSFDLMMQDGQIIKLHSDIIVKFGIIADKNFSQEQIKNFILQSDTLFATAKAIKYLTARIKSRYQVEQYLLQKQYDKAVINQVLQKLEEYNLINDQNFANAYVTQSKDKSANQIKAKLYQQKIDKDTITQLTDNYNELEIAQNTAKKFLKNKQIDQNAVQKLINHLQYKGFEWETISKTLKDIRSTHEDWD